MFGQSRWQACRQRRLQGEGGSVVRVLDRDDVQRLVRMGDALAAVREAFAVADRGGAVMPTPFALHLPDIDGELHVKGAYLKGAPVFAVKTALQAGIFDAGSVYGELAAVALGRLAGRAGEG